MSKFHKDETASGTKLATPLKYPGEGHIKT